MGIWPWAEKKTPLRSNDGFQGLHCPLQPHSHGLAPRGRSLIVDPNTVAKHLRLFSSVFLIILFTPLNASFFCLTLPAHATTSTRVFDTRHDDLKALWMASQISRTRPPICCTLETFSAAAWFGARLRTKWSRVCFLLLVGWGGLSCPVPKGRGIPRNPAHRFKDSFPFEGKEDHHCWVRGGR